MASEHPLYVGVDVGATKIVSAAYAIPADRERPGEALAQVKTKTPRTEKARDLVAAITASAKEAIDKAGGTCAGLGVAVPGPLDRAKGIVRYTPNLGLEEYPLADELSKSLGMPVYLENDVQAGVLGELVAGALRGVTNAVGIFIGTGIGGGLVLDGKLYRGSTGSAGEIGHMILLEGGPLCGCGNHGCLEALASRTAMAKDALALAASGKAPAMLSAAGTDIRHYRSSAFEEALEGKDEAIGKVIDRSGFWLGVAMANLVNVLNPEAIVVGGGVAARFGKRILKAAKESMEERLMPGLAGSVRILLSELGDLAVPTGAAIAARRAVIEAGGAAGGAEGSTR
jgi:glucokinase